MTDDEFAQATELVWSNMLTLTKPLAQPPTDEQFRTNAVKIRQALKILCPDVSDAEYKKILRIVRANMTVRMDDAEIVLESNAHKKWLDAVKSNVDWFFWTRYEKFLRGDKKLSSVVTATLNATSDRILDLAGDPNSAENFSRRGLIIGEVQSGKTAAYTALCNKAADVGYKVIIVLTGMLEDLRRQTQTRLDLEFAGRESQIFLSKGNNAINGKIVGVARYGRDKSIAQFTSALSDFSAPLLKSFSLDLKNLNGTALFVVKKNKRILENLIAWLKQSVDFGTDKIKHSLLLLDDEADNASVNTKKNYHAEQTAINAAIREILSLFGKTTYIGVTATPFANIFINPFDAAGMLNDDLFPRDFIFALDVPSNYIGAAKIFGGDNKNFVVTIEPDDCPDVEDIFPKRHDKYLRVGNLPESLCAAINYFLLVNAIRDVRGERKTHRTMLIHVSRFTNVHAQIYDLVNARLQEILNALRAYSASPATEAEKFSAHIAALHKIFDAFKLEELGGVSWEKILREYLRRAVEPIQVGLRNSTRKNSFSYEQNPDGLRVIAIGGNSFTRGLTLEGLCVTYFYRNSRNYDTLMQMGRWFGYRPNYADLCRLWTTQEIVDWYGFIADVSDEFKSELSFMREAGLTPKDFGLRVRRHPDTLEITAQNKMRFARQINWPVELSKVFIETPRLINDTAILSANENLIRDFIDGLNAFPQTEKNFWRGIPKNFVANLILNFQSGKWQFNFQSQPISEYITNKMNDDLWDVYIPAGDGALYDALTVGGEKISVNPLERKILLNDGQIQIGGQKRRVGRSGAAQKGLTAEQVAHVEKTFRAFRGGKKLSVPDNFYMIHERKPLLVLYVIRPKNPAPVEILFALGVGFPAASPAAGETNIKTADFVINAIGNFDDINAFELDDDFDEDGDDD